MGETPEPPELAPLREHFEGVRLLAQGGTSRVYRAQDAGRGETVALKVLDPALAEDKDYLPRFLREVRLLSTWEHRNIIRVYDHGADPYPWFTMELLEGFGLHEHLERLGRLTLAETLRLGVGLARALEYVHGQGYIHRDLKPANVLVDARGRPRLADFGLAAQPMATQARPRTLTGTLMYVAPEGLGGGEVDFAGDLYALGLILVECLVGEPFFELVAEDCLRRPRGELEELLPPEVPKELRRLLGYLLRDDPAARIFDARGVRRALKALLEEVELASPEEVLRELVTLERVTLGPLIETLETLSRADFMGRRAFLEDAERMRELRLEVWEVDRRTDRFQGQDDESSVAGVEAWATDALRFLMAAKAFLEEPGAAKVDALLGLAAGARARLRKELDWARLRPLERCLRPLGDILGGQLRLVLPEDEAPVYCLQDHELHAARIRDALVGVLRAAAGGGDEAVVVQHGCDELEWVVALKGPGIRAGVGAIAELAAAGGARAAPGEFGGLELRWPALFLEAR